MLVSRTLAVAVQASFNCATAVRTSERRWVMNPNLPDRNLLVCLDGTKNEPETGITNVSRLFKMALKDDTQLAYYDPGVGTMGARSATSHFMQSITRTAGLAVGYGIKDNIEEAYHWLMENYQAGDHIFIVGFSRGAYTARALTGMLYTVSLLRRGADNLIPYALKLYTNHNEKDFLDTGGWQNNSKRQQRLSSLRKNFIEQFANPEFPRSCADSKPCSEYPDCGHAQVAFLGLWDTVNSIGWLNFSAKFQQVRWPFTCEVRNVARTHHALAIDEKRRAYGEYRLNRHEDEMWFSGVHSDVGGYCEKTHKPSDHKLSDIALGWIADGAIASGLRIDMQAYKEMVGAMHGQPVPMEPLGDIHPNSWLWSLQAGWHHRMIEEYDYVHPSVIQLRDGTVNSPHPYQPRLPARYR